MRAELARPAALSRRGNVPPRQTAAPHSAGESNRSFLEQAFAFCAFALLLFSYVSLPSLKFAGQPLRGILALGLLLMLAVAFPEVLVRSVRKYAALLAFAIGFAVLGVFVSLANHTSLDEIVRTLMEVHLQIVVTLMVAAILAEIGGARACMYALVGVIGLSALVAAVQLAGVDSAWSLRRALGPLAKDDMGETVIPHRPMGLSYSPIQLATQICLAFAAYTAVRDRLRRRANAADPAVLLALGLLLAAALTTATRSPILGGVVFLGVYFAFRRGSWVPIAVLGGAVLLYLLWPLIMSVVESNAARVTRVDDKSAAARFVFAYYGTRLFIDNPLGYGFGFAPSEMWGRYWSDLYMMQAAARGAREHAALHNYPLTMINIYGIGILLFAPLAIAMLRRAGSTLIFFIPYAVHILFHNSGPFFSDMIIWFVIAAIGAAAGVEVPESVRGNFARAVLRQQHPFPRVRVAGGAGTGLRQISGPADCDPVPAADGTSVAPTDVPAVPGARVAG